MTTETLTTRCVEWTDVESTEPGSLWSPQANVATVAKDQANKTFATTVANPAIGSSYAGPTSVWKATGKTSATAVATWVT